MARGNYTIGLNEVAVLALLLSSELVDYILNLVDVGRIGDAIRDCRFDVAPVGPAQRGASHPDGQDVEH